MKTLLLLLVCSHLFQDLEYVGLLYKMPVTIQAE